MSGAQQQIVTAYEDLGLSVEQISREFSFDAVSIKAVLMQNSIVYREQNKQVSSGSKEASPDDFTQQDALQIKRVIMDSVASDDPHLAFKAAKYARDDYKGRLTPIKMVANTTINIVEFNISLQKARDARARVKQKAIEIGGGSVNVIATNLETKELRAA